MGKRRTRPPGRPPKLLEPGVRDTLLSALRLGAPIGLACEAASISYMTFSRWMTRGAAEHDERALDDAQPDEAEQVYLDLYVDVIEARAAAAVRNVGVIAKVAQGGTVTEKIKETLPDGTVRETEKRQAPDWRAAAWYLEKSYKGEFQKSADQLEISGPGGGPVQIMANAADLAERLSEHLAAGVAAPLALPGAADPDNDDDTVD